MNLDTTRFDHLYNLQKLDAVLVTTDIDWAPDFAVDFMLNELSKVGIKLTAFATHVSQSLKNGADWIETGLHPDFTRVSGREDFRRKFESLLDIYPQALGTRSHRNLFGQNTCEIAVQLGLKYELSHVQFQLPWCQAFVDQWGLTRASYSWEDGLHCDYKLPMEISVIDTNSKGLKIFNLHPILFYLNCVNDDDRRAATIGITDLTRVSESHLKPFVNQGRGIQTVTLELLRELKRQDVQFFLGREAFGNDT